MNANRRNFFKLAGLAGAGMVAGGETSGKDDVAEIAAPSTGACAATGWSKSSSNGPLRVSEGGRGAIDAVGAAEWVACGAAGVADTPAS